VVERAARADLDTLLRLAGAGRIRSAVTRIGGPEDVPALRRAMEGGHNRGKIVARLAPDP
jgi:NADPH:quinone reductase-like Zn-dependent oxidoreductase